MSPPLLDSGAPSGTLYGPSGAHSLQNPNPNGQFSASLSSRFYSVSNDQTHTMNSSNAKTGHSCLMDSNEGYPESGFNSSGLGSPKPAVGSASRLSKPRLTKMRKQAASHLPRSTPASETRTVGSDFNLHRPFSGNSATVMGTSVSGNFNFGQVNSEPFVFGTNRSNLDPDWNSGLGNSNENVGDAVLDDMRKLKIDSDKEYANACNTLFNSNLKMSGRKSKSGINESVVSGLPYEMQKLNIESSGNVEIPTNSKDVSSDPSANSNTYFCSETVGNAANLFGRDVVSELPNELKRLNIKGTRDGIAFGRTNFDSSDGGSATACANKIKNLNINDSASSCVGEKEVNVTTIGRDNKEDKFSFPSKWENIGTHVEFKTPVMRGKLHSHLNQNLEHSAKRELFRDNRSKKKKGKSKKPTLVQGWLGQDFMPRESGLQENPETSEPYSPMDISPYQETLAEGRCSRETSVTSNESFHLDSYCASDDTLLRASNITTNEDLVNATQHLDINEVDAGHTETKEEGTEYCFDKGVGAERLPEESISGTETESFITANEHFEIISDSSVTSAENEVSSSSNIERQDSDGGMQFCFASGSENTGQHNFTFSASSSAQNHSSVAARHLKKKNRMKVGHDSYISTPNAKLPYASSSVQFPPLSGTSLHLPTGQGKGGDTSTMQPKFEAVKGLETKQETVSIPAASVAAQEACEKWRLRGNQAYANGELSKAEEYYTRGLSCVSQNEASRSCLRALMLCYSNRAATQMSLGRMRKALRDCEMAAKIDPNFLRVQVRAANCYLALGEIEDAVRHFKKCLQSGSDVCVDRKLLVEASEGLQKAQKLSDFISHSADLLQRRSSSDTQNALEVIADALTISSYSEKLHHMKADGLFMLRKYDEVIQVCESTLHSAEMNSPESVLDRAPEHLDDSDLQQNASFRLWRYHLIVKSYFYLGRLEEALDFLRKQEESGSILEKNGSKLPEKIIPLAGTVRELLRLKTAGNEAFQSGRHAEAVDHYTAALSCNVESRPFVAVCFCNRAAAYRALGQITEAIADCSLAIALDGNYLKAISRRAALYENIRDYGQAAIDLERLVSLLTRQVEENATNYGGSDRSNCVNELRQAQLRLSMVDEEARKEIPLNMYLILGVEPSVAASEIKKAYRKAALRHHPDKAGQSLARSENGDDRVWKEVAEEVHKDADRLFKMIGEAYAVLSDPIKRSRYDLEEEMRNSQKRGGGISISRTHSDFQNYPFERGSSRRQWHEVWRSHGNSQTRGPETTRSYRYS